MLAGFFLILFGIAILFYPKILVVLLASLLITCGIGLMAVSWQFRRFKTQTKSRFISWITRF